MVQESLLDMAEVTYGSEVTCCGVIGYDAEVRDQMMTWR